MDEKLRQYIASNFNAALANGYIHAYYQPVIRSISGQLCSFEALARWIDPEWGFLRPDVFISVLEQEKLIHLLDGYVIREVCRRIRQSIDNGETPVPVSINLSRLDFVLCDIFSVVDQHVSDFQIPHDFLYIEITESVMAEQEGLMHTVVDRFHAAGYQVWMDDFGSGYSSLNMLKDYTFDELKLDMCFLRSFDERSRRIMTSIIHMAKELDIHTLTEGVETEEQYLYLRNVGCEKLQGFYFGKPLPYDEAMANLKAKGINVELPRDRKYYDDIGCINFLGSSPFISRKDRKNDSTGRQFNSIPLALAEMCKDSFTILFSNASFERNASSTILVPDVFRPEQFGLSHPYSVIPGRVVNLMESTRNNGEGRMLFVSNDEYYELKTKCVAKRKGSYSVLMQLNNLSQASQSSSTSVLDEGLRQIYTMFERISLMDVERNMVIPLYSGFKEDAEEEHVGMQELAHRIARKFILKDDREAFIRFWNPDTMEQRMVESGGSSISEYFRTRVSQGRYEWKQYIMVRFRPGQFLELVRSATKDMELFRPHSSFTEQMTTKDNMETLWQNILHTDVIRLFWKDRERRFMGVNQGFLNFYGFASEKEVLGKTDEELGWHVHPDLYMNDEYRVISEGITIHNIPGSCLAKGVNRNILASKTPLFDHDGDIVGMLGCFMDRDLLTVNSIGGIDAAYRDEMTGLLNARGLHEQATAFQDEFFLRNTDFMYLYVSLDNISVINEQFGFEFGDKVITSFGLRIKEIFGTSAAVGRVNGHQFVVIHQIHEKTNASTIRATVKSAADGIREIDGTSITLYFSIGFSQFSETKNLDMTEQSAEMRLMVDHDEHAPVENRQSRSSDFFRLYDDLPIAYAVYKVHANEERKVIDAEIFYANHLFEKRGGMLLSDMLGRSVRELFPELDEIWYDFAGRAALKGETIVENFYFAQNGIHYYMTATQVIRPGFCSITYQEIDLVNNSLEK